MRVAVLSGVGGVVTPGKQLRAWIRAKGWTVMRFAVELEVTESAVHHWSAGRRRPCEWRRVHIEALTGIPRDLWHLQHWRVKGQGEDGRRYWKRRVAGLCIDCEAYMDRVGARCEACLTHKRGGPRKKPARPKRRQPIRRAPSWIDTWREMRRAS